MKGIISNVRGQKISAELKVVLNKPGFDEDLINARLRKELPEYDLKAFSGVKRKVSKYVWEPREVFLEAVRLALLGVARLIHPEREYREDVSLTLLYETVLDFVLNRNDLIKAYEQNKK